jgi:hypothetical protein
MKAKELMIDGLFRVKKDVCLPKGTIVVIRGIDADKRFPKRNLVGSATCLPVNSSDGFTYGVWAEYLEPIPLTPEILEKNGFKKAPQISDTEPFDTDEEGNKHYSYNTTFWGWFQPDNIFCIPANGLGWLNIKYVHQLQHALRFARIKKEIIL